jgi:hypothetical protein
MMKKIFLSPLLGLFLISITFKSHAESYYGEFCWQTLINEAPAWIYKFGVSRKEGGNYALYGREDNGLGEITPAHGNAIVVNDKIMLTILGSGHTKEHGAWSETVSAVLNVSTLSGIWHALGAIHDNSDSLRQFHSTGTINRIACP